MRLLSIKHLEHKGFENYLSTPVAKKKAGNARPLLTHVKKQVTHGYIFRFEMNDIIINGDSILISISLGLFC